MHSGVLEIGKQVVARIFGSAFLPNRQHPERTEVSIFLCGGRINDPKSLRRPLRERIEKTASQYKYRVYYPETLFLELILGHERRSLLALENLLARCVGAVAIIVESPGTFAELGAFANHAELSKKLIVIMDEKFRTHQSFINLGPLRSLKSDRRWAIIFEPFDRPDLDRLSKLTCEAARRTSIDNPPSRDLSNPIEAMRAYLALVYVLNPISRQELFELVSILAAGAGGIGDAASTAINALISEGFLKDTPSGLSVIPEGMSTLLYGPHGHFWSQLDYLGLGALRLQAMNLRLRRIRKSAGRNTLNLIHGR